MNSNVASIGVDTGPEPSAVLVYDSFSRAIDARAMLERAAERAGEAGEWQLRPWRAELLRFPSMAEAAFNEAASANMVLLAVCPALIPMPWMMEWIERWATGRKTADACLAFWEDRLATAGAGAEVDELGQVARRHGVSLVLAQPLPRAQPVSGLARDLRSRESQVTPTLRGILAHPARDCSPH